MRPKIFSTRSEKAAANKIWLPDDAGWFDRRPGGKFLKMFVQIPLILGSLLMIPVVYEKIVPEKHRCKIKYGKADEH
uniref:Complex I-B15 n=1 Tax=Globodera pallida TaxID=36090 RepID=A0A183BYI7_GLOPA